MLGSPSSIVLSHYVIAGYIMRSPFQNIMGFYLNGNIILAIYLDDIRNDEADIITATLKIKEKY